MAAQETRIAGPGSGQRRCGHHGVSLLPSQYSRTPGKPALLTLSIMSLCSLVVCGSMIEVYSLLLSQGKIFFCAVQSQQSQALGPPTGTSHLPTSPSAASGSTPQSDSSQAAPAPGGSMQAEMLAGGHPPPAGAGAGMLPQVFMSCLVACYWRHSSCILPELLLSVAAYRTCHASDLMLVMPCLGSLRH